MALTLACSVVGGKKRMVPAEELAVGDGRLPFCTNSTLAFRTALSHDVLRHHLHNPRKLRHLRTPILHHGTQSSSLQPVARHTRCRCT
jgi:hypothetical protein